MRPLDVRRLGRVPYDEALALQRDLVEERRAGRVPDTLLLLEHPHVVTLGVRASSRNHILASDARLAALGVQVFDAGRGGDVTYHGPGQVVGYPILDLRPDRQDVHRYVRDLEEVLIRACGDLAVAATRVPGRTGAWVPSRRPRAPSPAAGPPLEKIAAIGVRISRWITSHGFALNVNVDQSFFRLIVPCGLADADVTSLDVLRGGPVDVAVVEDRLVEHFAEVFACEVMAALPAGREVSGRPTAP